jgi:membrane protease YdiL (CAAX protease family)
MMTLTLSATLLMGTLISALCALPRFVILLGIITVGFCAVYEGIIRISGVIALALLTSLAFHFSAFKKTSKKWRAFSFLKDTHIEKILFFLLASLSILAYLHYLPGFSNPRLLAGYRVSQSSAPLSLYINFDKTLAALLLCITLFSPSDFKWTRKDLKDIGRYGIFCATLLSLCVYATHAIAFDPKITPIFPIWAMINLLCVALPEEILFRGLLQNTVQEQIGSAPIALGVSTVAFGLAHIGGGITYVCLASIAGFFYGYTYQKTGSLFCSTLLHFSINALHICLFTYPLSAITIFAL